MDSIPRLNDKLDGLVARPDRHADIPRPMSALIDGVAAPMAHALIIRLDQGLYSLSIGPLGTPTETAVGLTVPCVQLTAPPSVEFDPVDIVTQWNDQGAWLPPEGGTVVIRSPMGGGLILATRYGIEDATSFALGDFQIHRLDQPRPAVARIEPLPAVIVPAKATPMLDTAPQPADLAPEPADLVPEPADLAPQPADLAPGLLPKSDPKDVQLEITLHIQREGDRRFAANQWCGNIGQKLQIEALDMRPVEQIEESDLEYKAFAPGGRETQWVAAGNLCGTRGRGIPLTGFAIRLSPRVAGRYEVSYQGAYFASGVTPPVRDGASCLPPLADDLLEAVKIRVRAKAGN